MAKTDIVPINLVQTRSELGSMDFQLKEVFEFLVYQRVIVFKRTMNDE